VIADLKEELAFLESDNHRLRHQAFSAGTTKVETMNLEEQIKVRPLLLLYCMLLRRTDRQN
jgi:hypothetical protein